MIHAPIANVGATHSNTKAARQTRRRVVSWSRNIRVRELSKAIRRRDAGEMPDSLHGLALGGHVHKKFVAGLHLGEAIASKFVDDSGGDFKCHDIFHDDAGG